MNENLTDARRQIATLSALLVANHVTDPERLDMSTLLTHCRSIMKLTAQACKGDEWSESFALDLTNAAAKIR